MITKIKLIIDDADPIGLLGMGCPDDEYESEIALIYQGLGGCSSEEEVLDLVFNTFKEFFFEDIGVRKDFAPIAAAIYAAKMAGK